MLVKIGDSYIDPAEIAAVTPSEDGVGIALRCGAVFYFPCSPAALEHALVEAGALEDNSTQEPPCPEADLPALLQLYHEGYNYLARDGDGALYAYRCCPEKDRAYWAPITPLADEVKVLGKTAFPFIPAHADAPFDLGDLFN